MLSPKLLRCLFPDGFWGIRGLLVFGEVFCALQLNSQCLAFDVQRPRSVYSGHISFSTRSSEGSSRFQVPSHKSVHFLVTSHPSCMRSVVKRCEFQRTALA